MFTGQVMKSEIFTESEHRASFHRASAYRMLTVFSSLFSSTRSSCFCEKLTYLLEGRKQYSKTLFKIYALIFTICTWIYSISFFDSIFDSFNYKRNKKNPIRRFWKEAQQNRTCLCFRFAVFFLILLLDLKFDLTKINLI